MNFQEFRATKVQEANINRIAKLQGFDTDDTRAVLVYADDTYIAINSDGTYHLQLGRSEWVTADLTELEARLFLWCQTECPGAMGLSDDEHRALCDALGGKGYEFAVLSHVYVEWCDAQGLPAMSADELIFEELSDDQRAWLCEFIRRWEAL